MYNSLRKFVLVTGAVLGSVGSSHATTVADLLSGGTITQDHLVFSNFTLQYDPANTGPTVDVGAFSVTFSTDETGTKVTFGGLFQPAAWGQSFNVDLGYTVATISSDYSITGINATCGAPAWGNAGATGRWDATAGLTVSASGVTLVSGGANHTAAFAEQSSVDALLHVQLTSTPDYNALGGGALISPSQTFTVQDIPEPATFILVGSGLAGLGLLRRRR